jgi:cell division transport system permease protein
MANLLESLSTEIRILNRIGWETIGGLRRTGWMNVVIVITMASILSIFGTLALAALNSHAFLKNLGANVQVSVYLDAQATPSMVRNRLEGLGDIRSIELVTRQEAWQQMKTTYADIPDIENPLPNTFHLTLNNPETIDTAVERIRNVPGVEAVNYPYSITTRIKQITQAVATLGIVFTGFLGLLTMFIISNTLSLLIQARGSEIEILRMMGVGNWYIRLPFLIQGMTYGLLSGVLAYLPIAAMNETLAQAFVFFQLAPDPFVITLVMTLVLLLGVAVGGSGALMSMNKYLKI